MITMHKTTVFFRTAGNKTSLATLDSTEHTLVFPRSAICKRFKSTNDDRKTAI